MLSAEDWQEYYSKSGIFSVRIPIGAKEDVTEFGLTQNLIAQKGQLIATFDQRPYKDVVKNYIVKYEQTFGQPLADNDIGHLISKELAMYEDYYGKLQGILKDRQDLIFQGGIPGGEIYITYQDPELGEQSIRARIFFIRSGKVTQIVSGPEELMHAFHTRKFFESLTMEEGFKKQNKNSDKDGRWKYYDSPLGIFTAYLPDVIDPYVKKPAKFDNSDTVERLSFEIYDPVWGDTLFYNIYGYVIPENFDYYLLETLMTQKHVLRHRYSAKSIKMHHMTNQTIPVVQTEYAIKPSKENPNNNWVKLRGQFVGPYAIVHELIGTPQHVRSPFADYMMSAVKFIPAQELLDKQKTTNQQLIEKSNSKN